MPRLKRSTHLRMIERWLWCEQGWERVYTRFGGLSYEKENIIFLFEDKKDAFIGRDFVELEILLARGTAVPSSFQAERLDENHRKIPGGYFSKASGGYWIRNYGDRETWKDPLTLTCFGYEIPGGKWKEVLAAKEKETRDLLSRMQADKN